MATARDVERALKKLGDTDRARASARFFKTGAGDYGHGDVFIGVTVPEQRKVAKQYRDLALREVVKLLKHETHECRLTALLMLIERYANANEKGRAQIVKFYLTHAKRVNNWDLVDLSAPRILGDYLLSHDRTVLYTLARSKNIWERRIAIVATLTFICAGESADTYRIAETLLSDTHDLIHKATGWMLREAGKRVSRAELAQFIAQHKMQMPRTMLRYAIEHFTPAERARFLQR